MKKIKLGIVGLGRIGIVHLNNVFTKLNNAEIYAASNVNEKIKPYLKEIGLSKFYNKFQDLVNDSNVDAVIIASPTNLHTEHIIHAIKSGKHVFCEKPIDLSFEKVSELVYKVNLSGVKFMVGYNRRFDPSFIKVKEYITSNKIGVPQIVKITSRDPNPPPLEYIKNSGGLFLDMAIHDFDMARHLINDEVYSVYSSGKVFGDSGIEKLGDIDTAITILTFINGAMATIDNSRKANYGYDQRIEVFGSKGMSGIDNKLNDNHFYADSKGIHKSKGMSFFIDRYAESYLNEMKHFIECILNDTKPKITGEDAILSLAIALAAKKSVMEKRVVLISEIS